MPISCRSLTASRTGPPGSHASRTLTCAARSAVQAMWVGSCGGLTDSWCRAVEGGRAAFHSCGVPSASVKTLCAWLGHRPMCTPHVLAQAWAPAFNHARTLHVCRCPLATSWMAQRMRRATSLRWGTLQATTVGEPAVQTQGTMAHRPSVMGGRSWHLPLQHSVHPMHP